tara:strand:+ start:302 stop:739 length:438 start_codon:yes stop_codon:yes gene_type:complete
MKSFRGLLASGDQITIRLGTLKGELGYKIKKFEIIGTQPGTETLELTGKIYTFSQDTVNSLIDFSNSELLGVAYYEQNSGTNYQPAPIIIFDNVTFNQDIFITAFDDTTSAPNGKPMNYYLELEQVKLDLSEAAVATLKDMRGTN